VTAILRAIEARRNDDLERQRVVAYELAGLIAVGFHDPKKMPEYKPLAQKRAKAEVNTPADDEHARGFLMLLALRSQQ
jgi:hypothetical protein